MKRILYTESQKRKIKNLLCILICKTNCGEISWNDCTGYPFLEQEYWCEYNNNKIKLFLPDQNYFNGQENGIGIKINNKKIISFDQSCDWKETEIGFKLNELWSCIWRSVREHRREDEKFLSKEGEEELDNLYKTMLIEDVADI